MMKLSEAILLGSVGTEQGFGTFSMYKESEERCALGAALAAIGREYSQHGIGNPYCEITAQWPWTKAIIDAPTYKIECITYGNTHIYDRIWQLNDIEQWTRPQIAAWVATLEEQYDKQEDGLENSKHVAPPVLALPSPSKPECSCSSLKDGEHAGA